MSFTKATKGYKLLVYVDVYIYSNDFDDVANG